ncbi:unnamed protein product, partial [Ixodes hexagonus]
MFDESTGVWIVHSVPRFPGNLSSGKYVFADNAGVFGQSILCVTFPTEQLNTIADQLRLQYPNIYQSGAPDEMKRRYPALGLLLNKNFYNRGTWMSQEMMKRLHSNMNNVFYSFAKHGLSKMDVYEAIAEKLQTSLIASTWLSGKGTPLPAVRVGSRQFTVKNVCDVRFTLAPDGDRFLKFNNSQDHSKWAISAQTDMGHYVCIGSLNRKEPQKKKGGETLCFDSPVLHRLL